MLTDGSMYAKEQVEKLGVHGARAYLNIVPADIARKAKYALLGITLPNSERVDRVVGETPSQRIK